MERERLMSLLADRPGCCAGLRAEAERVVIALEAQVRGLDAAIAENHKIIHQQAHEISTLRQLVRALRDVNVDLDGKQYGIQRAAYEGKVSERCRRWRGLHLAHGGELFERAADEIERLEAEVESLKDKVASFEDEEE